MKPIVSPINSGEPDVATMTLAEVTVDVTSEGFFAKPEQSTKEMAPEIAASAGIDHLTDDHCGSLSSCVRDTSTRTTLRTCES